MSIEDKISQYYSNKIITHGTTSQGVDWNSKDSQFKRFEQLCKIITSEKFSVIDYGCGYGALIEYLNSRFKDYDYIGYDISKEMIDASKKLFCDKRYFFTNESKEIKPSDYLIASGIFNVKLDTPVERWEKYIVETLETFYQLSLKGFAFNILTSYSDKEYMKDYLYYANPLFYFDYCKRKYSRNVALLHDYDLYEFTILVRKN
ncbi:MAG: class I SAM-dependent methyltransferase [Bacteroidia bacterium]